MKKITREGRRRIIYRHPHGIKEEETPTKKDENKQMQRFSDNVETYFKFIQEKHTNNTDNGSPFYVTLPPIDNMININVISEIKKHEVLSLYQEKSIDRIEEEYDMITVIPFRNRHLHLDRIIDSLNQSRLNSFYKIGILVIENSISPLASDIVKKYDNCHYRWLDSKDKMFNKCICHNLGVYITNSKFVHFHDCDLIVPPNFYNKVMEGIRYSEAVQCFTKRRVNYLNEIPSKKIFDGAFLNDFTSDQVNYRIGNYGAPGGSIALTRDLFNRAGGFDSHLFWSYSIEDAFFWEKMKTFTDVAEIEIELYHLWHPPAHGKNPHERFERKYYEVFSRMPDKNQYINTSKKIYNETMEYLTK